MKNLVIVPGHGVCKAGYTYPTLVADDASWVGIFPGEGNQLVQHAQVGINFASHPDTALIFSGGVTRRDAGYRSEGYSYFEIARDHGWWGYPKVLGKTLVEGNATDSLQNLLFCLLLFRDQYHDWPEQTFVVGWGFKHSRYELFAEALGRYGILTGCFEYISVNNPSCPNEANQAYIVNEQALLEHMKADPLLREDKYQRIRQGRDPFGLYHPYGTQIQPEFSGLIKFLEGKEVEQHAFA